MTNKEVERMSNPIKLKPIAGLLVTTLLLASLALSSSQQTANAQTNSIDLEEFRWSYSSFPLRVLVDMNQWSVDAYAPIVHDTLDTWLASIWNYTASYDSTNLNAISYLIFFSDVNSTSNYDILITFSQTRWAQTSSVSRSTTSTPLPTPLSLPSTSTSQHIPERLQTCS